MSEPDISTLARRLAEQNNVDWRVLRGSGPDGKVVERDVLDFLAKVMAGEEAVNPTPEPVPDGMEAWPAQDIQGFRTGVGEAATLGELRDELGNASRDYLAAPADTTSGADQFEAHAHDFDTVDDAAEPAYGAPAAAVRSFGSMAGSDDGIDEDIFLFEDDDAPVVGGPGQAETAASEVAGAAAPMGAVAAGGAMQVTDDLEDLLVAGDDFDSAGASGGIDTYATSSQDSRFGGVSTGYLGDDDQVNGHVTNQDHGVSSTGYDAGSSYPADLDHGTSEPAATTSSWGDSISFGAANTPAHDQDGDVPDLWGPAATAKSDDSDLWTGPAGATVDSFTDTPFIDAISEEAAEAADLAGFHTDEEGTEVPNQQHDAWLGTEPTFADEAVPAASGSDTDAIAAFGDSPGTEALPADLAGEVGEATDEVAVWSDDAIGVGFDDGIEVGLAAVGATLLSAGAATLPLARPGTILRRNIDVSALAAAQLAVGQELGYDEPLGASAFLLRAVVKAAASTGFSTGAVGLAVLEESVTIKRVDGAADMSFTDLVKATSRADVEEDEPVLVAADLSGLEVDEAVLELPMPVISLGRILYDNQRGAYRSTLSLTGPMPLDTAANLLARVAELLDAPVRLVL